MKKKNMWLVLIVATVILGIYLWWPRSMGKVLVGEGHLSVLEWNDGILSSEFVTYELEADSETLQEITELFREYNYYLNWRTIFSVPYAKGDSMDLRYVIQEDDGSVIVKNINIFADGYIRIEGTEFRCRDAGRLMGEIREVLKDVEPEK